MTQEIILLRAGMKWCARRNFAERKRWRGFGESFWAVITNNLIYKLVEYAAWLIITFALLSMQMVNIN